MSDDRSWYTADYPELRDAPPWVMQEMIEGQLGLPAAILDAPSAGVGEAREAIRAAAAGGMPIVITGCGTSEHGAMAVAALIADALPDAWVESRQALDAAITPRPGGVCVGISHDGGTPATQQAMQSARAAGATIVAVTAKPESHVAGAADHVVTTPMLDRSWCHTVAYTSAILAGVSLVESDDTSSGLAKVIESALGLRPALADAARTIHGDRRIITTGLGTDEISARELALKIEEGARIPATAHQLETLLHGHLAGCDADRTAVVRIATDPRGGELHTRRRVEADAALAAIGIPTVVLGPPLGVASASSPAEALISAAVVLQLLTLELAHAAGTNPDLIRREQRPYREAAAAAGG